jgi:hypothetical protein
VTRLVPIHNPHPGGTYIWFTVPDGCVITAEAECQAEAAEPEPQVGPETAREYADKLLSAALETEYARVRYEPTPYDLGITDDPEAEAEL